MMLNEQRCATCAHWCRRGAQIAKAVYDPSSPADVGTCQEGPPQMVKVVGGWIEAVFPVTHESRFCGLWQQTDPVDDGPDGGEDVRLADLSTVVPINRRAA